jgi:Ca-activated chloride channel family protein
MHISAHLDIDLIAIDEADHVTALLELTAPENPATQQRPGRTLMLVLDRSGSMDGEPLTAAKDAIARLVRQLAPHDCFGLVTFDNQAEVVIPPMLMADHAMEPLQRAIAGIRSGGSTDLAAGYVLALREVKRSLAETKHTGATVLLVSDGHANHGITEPDRLKEVATKALTDGIATSTLGLGLGYDELLLDAITRGGNGNHRFAPDIDTAVHEIQQTVTDLLDVSVIAATLRITPQGDAIDGIRLRQDLPVWREPGALVINIGDLYAGEERKVLLAFDVPAVQDLGTCTIAEITIDFTTAADLVEHHIALPLSVNVVPGDQARDRVPNPVVQIEQLLADADEAKKAATQALRSHDTDRAKSTLDGTLRAIRRMRTEVAPVGDEALLGRLDEASSDLEGLRMSLDIEVPVHSMKLMTDSLAMSSRGRKPKPKPAPKPSSSGSAVRPPRDSGDVDDSGEVASG